MNVLLPPIAARLQVTARPVEAGLVPGVTAAVSVVLLPAVNKLGVAVPVAPGFVGPPLPETPRTEISSMASACEFVVVVPELTE